MEAIEKVAKTRNAVIPLHGSLILIFLTLNPQVTQTKSGKASLRQTGKSTMTRRRNIMINTRKRRKPSVLDNKTLGKPTATTNLTVFHVKSLQKRMTQHKL